MSRLTRILVLGALAAAGAVAGMTLARRSDSGAVAAGAFGAPDFCAAAEFAKRSVVHITTRTGVESDFWQPQENVGSGVIVSDRGHILTNSHVVEGAQTLLVRFSDGREIPARVVGTDVETDMALLEIDVPGDLTLVPATFADSDKVLVGEWCLAIGSPFGYNHTVTSGIVSAKHRRSQLSMPYQDFIQTDAAINPGNSGGALVNVRGELIGVNTAIVSPTRGNDGIGLAISSNLVRWVRDRLVKEGRVRRGFLGIRTADIDTRLVDAFHADGVRTLDELLGDLGLKEARGVFVAGVEPGSAADRAGLKPYDIILEFGGNRVGNQGDFMMMVAEMSPGVEVPLAVLRDRKPATFRVELSERPPVDLRRLRR